MAAEGMLKAEKATVTKFLTSLVHLQLYVVWFIVHIFNK
jgi:hypothetical protein